MWSDGKEDVVMEWSNFRVADQKEKPNKKAERMKNPKHHFITSNALCVVE